MSTVQAILIGLCMCIGLLAIYLGMRDDFIPGDISGKRVLITGASGGIGESLAYQYAEYGANVFISARRESRLEKVLAKCKDIGAAQAKFAYIVADMANSSQVDTVIPAAIDALGGLDILILNHAFIPVASSFDDEDTYKQLDIVMKVNFFAYIHLAKQSFMYLKNSGGRIVVLNSIAGKVHIPMQSHYSATKFALDGFFGAIRLEMKRCNISVTSAVLGFIETEVEANVLAMMEKKYVLPKGRPRHIRKAGRTETAYHIMKAAARRDKELCYPPEQYIWYWVIFREVLNRMEFVFWETRHIMDYDRKLIFA